MAKVKTVAKKVYVGGWFQRTGLHLFEVYDFLTTASSPLDLDGKKLKRLHGALKVKSFQLKVGDMEYIDLQTQDGIHIKIFEDGLVTLGAAVTDPVADVQRLKQCYKKRFLPIFDYLFSLGAPVPKELSNIQSSQPYFLVTHRAKPKDIDRLLADFKQERSFEIHRPDFDLYRGDKLYIVNSTTQDDSFIERLVEGRIFIREFKTQIHSYLDLHRIIWEKIARVKEQKYIYASQAGVFLGRLEEYKKTINLIETRINQMGLYIHTRVGILQKRKEFLELGDILEFKYDAMENTLEYVKQIWVMTQNYVNAAIEVFTGIQNKSTGKSVENLTIITSMGVGATLMGLFAAKLPTVTVQGALYFLILAGIGFGANRVMKLLSSRKKYKINNTRFRTDIHWDKYKKALEAKARP